MPPTPAKQSFDVVKNEHAAREPNLAVTSRSNHDSWLTGMNIPTVSGPQGFSVAPLGERSWQLRIYRR